ncbi:hypothetical protein B7P43_G12775 [Cryptotermes secundus]|uniref:SAM domain-containing protein n=1 Tax=Cryptotermes secundus TaxID=105785 RepID=A0A2J7QGK9_9NEOP|nr:protein bicaudal C homolog 1 [Cryptotermes secundus]PNF27721.1 hypothetical protein B7P43_G12775 [Cryptotermes secundus]
MHPDQKGSDALSEVSDGGTAGTSFSGQGSSYGGSNENLRDLAATLGLSGIDELYEERFRVDRRKLEHMILGDDEALEPADSFFQKIMIETNTYIMWPSRLKIGAKSKKDPHVRVAGRREEVKVAKEKVMEVLDTRSNRVTMKLDVSYTDHSHIIGKGGLTIKKVMEETGCHIHFPDSNRSNLNEKSNQVSIAGEMDGVEQARARIRKLTPLIFSFELPIVGTLQSLPDSNSTYLRSIQEKYNVHVMFRNRPKLYGTMVVIKGCEWEVAMVKQATLLVIQHMCESLAAQVQVHMTLEISPQHHSIVLGKNSNNLKQIMQQTSTKIMFPDAGDPNISSLKKSNICITGTIHNVYLARQHLMGSLPIVLMFDLPEDMVVDTDQVSRLMQYLDVFISIRRKPKQNVVSVIIKGIERNATSVYEARNKLLGLEEPRVVADIPKTYHIPDTPSAGTIHEDIYGTSAGRCPVHHNLTINTGCIGLPGINIPPLQGALTPPFPSPAGGICNTWSGGFGSPTPVNMGQFLHTPILSQSTLNHLINLQQQQLLMQHVGGGILAPNLLPTGSSCSASVTGSSSSRSHMTGSFSNSSQSLASDTKDTNVFSSLSSNTSSLSSPAISPQTGSSPVQKNGVQADSTNAAFCSMMSDLMNHTDRRAPGCEKKTLELAAQQSFNTFDFDKKKLLAYQAMQTKPVPGNVRVPTSAWSGYGLSHSSPAPDLEHRKKESFAASLLDEAYGTEGPTNSNLVSSPTVFPSASSECIDGLPLSASNYLDSVPASTVNRITGLEPQDLGTLLTVLGLEKYIKNFTDHEIDLTTFASLNDSDLREIGVSTVGARRKMLWIISELKSRQNQFYRSAAPGAERKASTSMMVSSNGIADNW